MLLLTIPKDHFICQTIFYIAFLQFSFVSFGKRFTETFVTSHSPSSLLNVIVTFSNGGAISPATRSYFVTSITA
ncbi:hypothetical protein BCE_1541 [Bacillus cereus ATCC 10987]|uniref:Uncharacterized protein n=1 Tax=Bacillus cereus (strain ATCC 10987 / NRS 248) TaxID=222523 RepID=Q73B79_BACC1|nr:hypothetical protein BCE_1541 [Bacillus cereus ATCC 10987]